MKFHLYMCCFGVIVIEKKDYDNIIIYADINECSDSSLCDQVCENTIGSYTCDCYTGFMLVGDQCQGM